jgi:hypothetical protein
MRLDAAAALLACFLVAAAVGFAGCSDGEVESSLTGASLDEKVMSLSQGVSSDIAKNKLGVPQSEVTNEGETVLYYQFWQLVFMDGLLEKRSREYRPESPTRPESAVFDHKILSLKRGMYIRTVKATLGTPTSYEEVFRGGSMSEKILRYGPWEITFTGGELTRRTKF